MNQNASDQIVNDASAAEGKAQEAAPQPRNEVIPTFSVAGNPIVQCLLIAARRGRQIRLARAARLEMQLGESETVSEETSQTDET
jgi:hypothetical protein